MTRLRRIELGATRADAALDAGRRRPSHDLGREPVAGRPLGRDGDGRRGGGGIRTVCRPDPTNSVSETREGASAGVLGRALELFLDA